MHSATAFAPANIALAKYWGKRDAQLNLPTNGSLSISLAHLGTTTTISAGERDQLYCDHRLLPPDTAFAQKVWHFIAFCQPKRPPLVIHTQNNIPTAAGLASSASGFAALTLALNDFFQWSLSREQLSQIARRGSGSACRSLWQGFVYWQKGEKADGSDCYARPIASDWQDLRLGIITIDAAAKKISSRQAMNHTAASSPLFSSWTQAAEADLKVIYQAVLDRDFLTLAQTAEANALMMHASLLAARPAIFYWQPQTLATLQRIWQARAEGLAVYATLDAGANVKLLYRAQDEAEIASMFPQAQLINPFQTVTSSARHTGEDAQKPNLK